jgi:hypothetical protein
LLYKLLILEGGSLTYMLVYLEVWMTIEF